MPVLPVRLSYGHGKQTPSIQALIDSGAADTLFRADIGQALGIKVQDGIKSDISGIVPGAKLDVFYHQVNLWVGADMIRIVAGFAPELSVAALLGRCGFFEHFIVKFDPSNNPPGFEITRLGRA